MDKIKNVAQRLGIITVKDMERYTALELITMIANKMNEFKEIINDQNDKIQYLLNEGLLEEVAHIFDEWIQDGTFDTLINQSALKKVNDRIDETNTQLSMYDTISVKNFGAIGDGISDDTDSIIRAIEYCTSNNKLLHMSGDFYITNTINVTCDIYGEPNFFANVGRNQPVIRVAKHRLNIKLGDVQDYQNKNDYYNNYHGFNNDNYIGILVENVHGCEISFNNCRTFNIGVKLSSSSNVGCAFNEITGKTIMNCKDSLMLFTTTGGWVNTNIINNISFSLSNTDDYLNDSSNKHFLYEVSENGICCDSNIFNFLRMETTVNFQNLWCIELNSMRYSVFNDLRTEIVKNSVGGIKFNSDNGKLNIVGVNFYNQMNFGSFSKSLPDFFSLRIPLTEVSNIFGSDTMVELYSNHDIIKDVRYPLTDYQCIIKGCQYVKITDETINKNQVYFTRNDISDRYGISFNESQPFTVFIHNTPYLSTYHLKYNGKYTRIRLKCWDENDQCITEENLLGGLMSQNSSKTFYQLDVPNAGQNVTFSVISAKVKKVTIHFDGYLFGFSVLTPINNDIAPDMNSIVSTSNAINRTDYMYRDFIFNEVPTKFSSGRFSIGERVYDFADTTTNSYWTMVYDDSSSNKLKWIKLSNNNG